MIYNIAIVEDENDAAETLTKMINKYQADGGGDSFRITRYANALTFLMEDCLKFDIIFLDIQLPDINGLETARKIREKDEDIIIVFVTNMAQYAVESYEVHAYDFILKPVKYGHFLMKFKRVLKALEHKCNDDMITLSTRFEKKRVRILDIIFVEVINHDLFFHLSNDEFRITGTMNEIEKQLAPYHFVRLSVGYLANLKYVTAVRGEYAVVGGQELRISRSRRQAFMTTFAKYAGGSE